MVGRFCSLDQTHLECESTLVEIKFFRPRNWVKTKEKKRSSPISSEDKKKELPRPKFVGFFAHTGPFLSDQPVLKSRWGTQNLVVGTLTFDGRRVLPTI